MFCKCTLYFESSAHAHRTAASTLLQCICRSTLCTMLPCI
jgi:hypothetical protein